MLNLQAKATAVQRLTLTW